MIKKIIKKLFLVKEIVSKQGELHFQRYRFFASPWCNIYLHHILKSDEDIAPHSHPWNFVSLILKGGYFEEWIRFTELEYRAFEVLGKVPELQQRVSKSFAQQRYDVRKPGSFVWHSAYDYHKLTLLHKDVWTLVFTLGKHRDWGYLMDGNHYNYKDYRQLKNKGELV